MLLLSQVFENFNIVDKLEKSQVFRPEDILVSQMISVIVGDFPFIAEVYNSAFFHIGLGNLKNPNCKIRNAILNNKMFSSDGLIHCCI